MAASASANGSFAPTTPSIRRARQEEAGHDAILKMDLERRRRREGIKRRRVELEPPLLEEPPMVERQRPLCTILEAGFLGEKALRQELFPAIVDSDGGDDSPVRGAVPPPSPRDPSGEASRVALGPRSCTALRPRALQFRDLASLVSVSFDDEDEDLPYMPAL